MNYKEVREPQKPFPLLYNEFKKDIVATIQNYVQKGVPYCCVSEAMNDFARQCAENSNLEYNDSLVTYDNALKQYADYVTKFEKNSKEDTPDKQESVTDGQI